jgi:DnaB-like helicase C terminal domain
MGAQQSNIEPKSPTAATMGVWDKYDRALETLACRAVGEPYNFFRVDSEIHPAMFGTGFFGQVLAMCQKQFRRENRYSAHTVAAEMSVAPETISALAMRDTEIDLPFAFDMFRGIYGQFVEIQIADFVSGWIAQGKTSEEVQVEAGKMRREKGVTPRATGSDGKDEFQAELFAALEGKVFDYPVKPHLAELRKLVPHYEPGEYIVVAALSGVGKTYYGLNTIYHNSLRGIPSCCINLENTPKNIQKRIWQMHGGNKFRRNLECSDDETRKHLKVWEEVKKMPFKSLNPGPTLPAILSAIRHDYNERGIQFALIDYAQLISIPGYRGGRNYELGEISAAFRALSLELQIPIMVLAQMKQEVSKTGDRRGGMYDIKDCANFAQDATFVQTLYRPFYFEIYEDANGNPYTEKDAEVTVVKGRETGRMITACEFDPIRGYHDAEPEFSTQPEPKDFTIPQSAMSAARANEDDIPF